jgi:hypothetical protein
MGKRCKECDGKVCVCEFEGKWAAHCMDCDNTIGERGTYDPCADSRGDAIARWDSLNA